MMHCIRRVFSFKGRAARSEWLITNVVLCVIGLLLYVGGFRASETLNIPLIIVVAFPPVFAWFAVSIRRLHDMNVSAGWMLLPLVVFYREAQVAAFGGYMFFLAFALSSPVGAIVAVALTAFLGFLKGTSGSNKYGPDPCGRSEVRREDSSEDGAGTSVSSGGETTARPMKKGLKILIYSLVFVVSGILCTFSQHYWSEKAKSSEGSLDACRKAAEQGDVRAQLTLASCYARGDGVARDMTESMRWIRKAAEQGDAEAQFVLGLSYVSGEDVARDTTEAVRWFRKAAELGNAKAQFYLGLCYHDGEGVGRDMTEAVRWLRKAAEQGNEDAIRALQRLGQ